MMRHNPPANSYIYLVSLLTLLLAGCNTSQQQSVVETTDSSFRLIAPDTITTPRAIDPDEIWPVVKPGTDTIIDMTQIGDAWTGPVNVPANTIQTLSVSWFIKFQNQDLELARFEQSYSIGAEGIYVPLDDSAAYNTDIDTDNDNVSNLDELTNQSDPFVLDDGLDVVDVLITERASGEVPVIDGLGATYSADAFELAGEWAGTVQKDALGRALLVNNLMIDNDGYRGNGVPFHRWAATHDGTYLYLLVLADDIGNHQSDSTGFDDDDGTGRDGKWGWFHPPLGTTDIEDGTWRIPRLMATAVIQ